MNFLKEFEPRGCDSGKKIGRFNVECTLQSDESTLLDTVCKNTYKIYTGFVLNIGYYFSIAHLVMILIVKISKKEIGLITDVD